MLYKKYENNYMKLIISEEEQESEWSNPSLPKKS